MSLISHDYRDFEAIRRDFRWQVPERFNMARAVCERHVDLAGRPALFHENAAGERRTWTFGELHSLSSRLANALRHLGVEKGDRVGIVLPQRVETGLAHLAIHKLGAISLPLSVLFGPDAVEYRLKDSGARAVITLGRHVEMIQDLRGRLPALETVIACDGATADAAFWPVLEAAAGRFDTVDTLADDPALLIYTSGTTGPPKGALVAHRALLGNLPGFELSQNFYPKDGDVFWTPADWAWTGGLLDGLLPAWYYGTPIVGYEGGRFDPDHAVGLVERYGVSNAFVPPTALKMIRQVPGLESRRFRWRGIMSAGEAMGAELYEWGREVLGIEINEMWGQTEFNYLVGNAAPVLAVRPGSMGCPYPGHEVDAIDDDGNILPRGEPGELAARTGDPVMFLGYWNNDAATREKITGGWFRTGDVGYRDEDGYIWFVGRKDDVISTAGHRVGPGEIEDCLLKHPAVAQAAVIGKPDELRGSVIKAFIVLARGHAGDEALKRDIRDTVKSRLAAYEYPREIEFIDEMPMTTTGKVRRMALRARESG